MIKSILGILLLGLIGTTHVEAVDQVINTYIATLPCIEDNGRTLAEQVTTFLLKYCPAPPEELEEADALYAKITRLMDQDKPLRMYMPGFPCKSRNRTICITDNADLGEYLALITLEHICAEIAKVYKPSAHITIVSDGYIYNNDIVAPHNIIAQYHQTLFGMVKHFPHVDFQDGLSLEGREWPPETLRSIVSSISLEALTKEDTETATDMRGFVKKQLALSDRKKLKADDSKRVDGIVDNLLCSTKRYSILLKQYFPEDEWVRMSVHPHRNVSKKLGINLIYGHRGTPWHNSVILLQDEQRFVLTNGIDYDEYHAHDYIGFAYLAKKDPREFRLENLDRTAGKFKYGLPWKSLNP